jgi:uncharacterized protein YjbI with pentapeptide repeats
MANIEHLAHLKEGVEKWNQWRKDHDSIKPDLSSAKLNGEYLFGANFWQADLACAEFRDANLTDTNFQEANLDGADLSHTILHGSTLSYAALRGADLRKADLHGALLTRSDLSEADLSKANFSGVEIGWTTFGNLDLRQVKALNLVTHIGPSTIGIDTIYRSAGHIPHTFLREAGVPESFIREMNSLFAGMKPLEFSSCFISYSSHDHAFAERLHSDLRTENLRCWFAPEDLKIGDRFQERIEESIQVFDKVIIVLSEASVESRWVEREVNAAREREERDDLTVLFPIRIDDEVMKATQPWAADIRRSRHIGDFRGWEVRASYLKAFERLLRDLQAKDLAAQ